jgi:hypothetical protein
MSRRNPTAEQVLAKVRVLGADECWPWMGRARKKYDGRGIADWNGRTHSAPRVVWAIHAQIMPPSHLYVCHTCNNPTCCNLAHLYLGTHAENLRFSSQCGRTAGQKKTHCPQGHPYDEGNTYKHTYADGTRRRHCRTCKAAWMATHNERKAA